MLVKIATTLLVSPGLMQSPTSLKAANSVAQAWDSGRYQDQHAFVYEFGSSLIDLLEPQPRETILDVGCGTGELTNEISSRCSHVVGIDTDQEMIAAAREQFQSPKVQFNQVDARAFSARSGFAGGLHTITVGNDLSRKTDLNSRPLECDAVFSNAALHWIKEPELAIQSIAQSLRPGGRFVAEFGGEGNVGAIADFLDKHCGKDKNPWYFPSIAEYSALLEGHGLEVKLAQLYDRPTELSEGPAGLRNWILMFAGAYLQNYEGDQEALLQKAEKELCPMLWNGEAWIADYRRIRIVAVDKRDDSKYRSGETSTKEIIIE